MSTILDFLGRDHRTCDGLFAAANAAAATKDWDRARTLFARFSAAMGYHLEREERVLFPAFEARTANSMGPTRVMRMEHEQMRALMQALSRTLAGADHCRYLGLSETLSTLIRHHNLKEENLLFPMFDQMLDDERETLIGLMRALPDERPGPARTAAK